MSQPDIDYFEHLERDDFNNRLYAKTIGCGCCSGVDEIPIGEEQDYILRHIENLRAKIAVWEKELDAE